MTDPSPPERPVPVQRDAVGAAAPIDLAAAQLQMAGLVLSRETVDSALNLVTTLAAAVTANTLGAAVTLVDEHGTRSRAATDRAAEQADALQYELDEGPCLTAWRTRQPVRIDDTTTDTRWPGWSAGASRLGVRSVLSTPLLAADESIGAMKVYSASPGNYGPHEEQVLRIVAAQAAILLANTQSLREARRLSKQLSQALTSRDAVVQATGVLLARGAISQQDAFATLAAAARQSGRPVEEVARSLLAAVADENARSATRSDPPR